MISLFFFFLFCYLIGSIVCTRDFQEGDLEELERTVEPSWSKLVEPLEKIVDRLNVVWGIVNHLKSVKDTADLRVAIEEVQVYSRYLDERLRLLC